MDKFLSGVCAGLAAFGIMSWIGWLPGTPAPYWFVIGFSLIAALLF